jgi:ABC-type uncharacterized transport system permease subunit
VVGLLSGLLKKVLIEPFNSAPCLLSCILSLNLSILLFHYLRSNSSHSRSRSSPSLGSSSLVVPRILDIPQKMPLVESLPFLNGLEVIAPLGVSKGRTLKDPFLVTRS